MFVIRAYALRRQMSHLTDKLSTLNTSTDIQMTVNALHIPSRKFHGKTLKVFRPTLA